ncbi:MAG: hypothetical protein Q4D06_09475 [Coriobacteriia bacterium]|nr:hypothetical protein [Coriobacteriia bacterium]
MSDRVIENDSEEVPEIPEVVEAVLLMALDEAKVTMVGGDEITPFTCLVVKDNVFIESHPGDDADECFANAKKEVANARGAQAYAFCYDGFVETDDGPLDVIIAEGGLPGSADGYAIGLIYEESEEGYAIDEEAVYIGEAPNFMMDLYDPSMYDEEEIDQKYLEQVFGVEDEEEE